MKSQLSNFFLRYPQDVDSYATKFAPICQFLSNVLMSFKIIHNLALAKCKSLLYLVDFCPFVLAVLFQDHQAMYRLARHTL